MARSWWSVLALLAALAITSCAAAAPGKPQTSANQPQGFVSVLNNKFVDEACQEFYFHGWNGWRVVELALNQPDALRRRFKDAHEAGLNVLRFFLGDDERSPVLQTAPGVFDERVAAAVDLVISEAAAHGIRVTPVLLNQWKKNNGVPQFEEWCGTASSSRKPRPDIDMRGSGLLSAAERLQTPYDWLMSDQCRAQVKTYLTALVNRRNSITGVLYKDDSTIISWDLLNEPRCRYCGPEAVDSWIGEMAAHLKSVDPNHMTTTGAEGFFDERDAMAAYNPQDRSMWGSRTGQDFRSNHAHPDISYATLHTWPDNWSSPPFNTAWGRSWIDAHSKVASSLGKPLVLEEFGKEADANDITAVRDPWFTMVYDAVESSIASGGPLRGSLFWQWDTEGGDRSSMDNSIRQTDSTFVNHIQPHAQSLAARASGAPVPGCTPRSSAPATAATGDGSQGEQPTVQSFAAGRKLLEA